MSQILTFNTSNIAAGAFGLNPISLGGLGIFGGVVATSGNVKNLYINSQDPTGSETVTVTLYKNNAATLLQAVINGGDVSAADVTHTISVAAGDNLMLVAVNSGGSAATTVQARCELNI